jgi:hypothetical protein
MAYSMVKKKMAYSRFKIPIPLVKCGREAGDLHIQPSPTA